MIGLILLVGRMRNFGAELKNSQIIPCHRRRIPDSFVLYIMHFL